MRKPLLSLVLAAVASLAATPAQAFFEANLSGGYTTVAMGELNDAMSNPAFVSSSTKVSSGYYIAADAGVSVFPFLKLVPRVAFIQANEGGNKSAVNENTVSANLVPLELGLTSDVSLPLTGLSVRGGIFGGYGMAAVATTQKDLSTGIKTGSLYQGSGFVAEVLGAVRYDLMPLTAISLELGYRMANIAKVNDGKNDLKKNATDAMPIDFSGMNVGLGLSVGF